MIVAQPDARDGLTARQLAHSLMPNLFDWENEFLKYPGQNSNKHEADEDTRLLTFLLWPPDLFALTSSILSLTGAYNAVVSPPSGLFIDELCEWLRQHYGAEAEEKYKSKLRKHFKIRTNPYLRDTWRRSFCWPPLINLSKIEIDDGRFVLKNACKFGDPCSDPSWQLMVRRIALEWRLRIERCCRRQAIQLPSDEGSVSKSSDVILPELLADTSKNWSKVEPLLDEVIPPDLRDIWKVVRGAMTESPTSTESVYDLLCESNWRESLETFDRSEFWEDGMARPVDDDEERRKVRKAAIHFAVDWSVKRIQLNFALQALLTVHAISDEASTGFGVRSIELEDESHDISNQAEIAMRVGELIARAKEDPEAPWRNYRKQAVNGRQSQSDRRSALLSSIEKRMQSSGTLATINFQHCRVLPKRHTPSVGITLRSISCNLGFHRSSVDVRWLNPHPQAQNPLEERLAQHPTREEMSESTRMSILLLPWPLSISAQDFREVRVESLEAQRDGLFTFAPVRSSFSQDKLANAIRSALLETKSVDMVILPECALSEDEIDVLEAGLISVYQVAEGNRKELAHPVSAYIAGVRRDPKVPGDLGDNMVYFKTAKYALGQQGSVAFPRSEGDADVQYKHHKWKIDTSQVVAYSLGHRLAPGTNWWEAIRIRRRRVTFMNIGERITVCPLICEDLARQDPISDLIRTAGPTLVVTILMDGPQLRGRWSSNYASVLADDPGCAVITLSSFGMVDRWKPDHAKEKSRVVAHWRDAKNTSREIALEEGAIGILLSVTVSEGFESTADGREEVFRTSSLQLGAIKQVFPYRDGGYWAEDA